MEPANPSYSAILSSDKQERRPPRKTHVNVHNSFHRPCSAPLDDIIRLPAPTKEPRITPDGHREQLLHFHDKKLRRRDALVLDGTANIGARGHWGQLGRRNSRGARYQHIGQWGGLSQRDRFPHIAYTGSSPKTGDKESDSGRSTATRKTYARRRKNSSSPTSVSSLEDYQTPRSSQAQRNPASRTTLSGNITQTSLTQETSAMTATSPGRGAMPPLPPSPL